MALTELKRTPIPGKLADLVTYQGTNPAGGSEWNEAVPARKCWRLLAVRASLTTTATVNNRRVRVIIDDGVNTLFQSNDESVQAASLTHGYNIAPQASRPVQDVEHYLPLPSPDDLVLNAGYRVRASTLLFDGAGDDWGVPIFTVEEITF